MMKKSNQRDCLFPKPSSGEFVSQNLVQASLLLKSYLLPSPSLTDLIVFLYAPVAAAAANSCQSCPTLCDPLDSSPPGSCIPGILQARTLVFIIQCMKVKSESEVAQLCPTLSNPMDCSLPGSSVHGIFQARVLEWVAIAFSSMLL